MSDHKEQIELDSMTGQWVAWCECGWSQVQPDARSAAIKGVGSHVAERAPTWEV